MRRRRSERDYTTEDIDIEALADCLLAGNGITGFYNDEFYGQMPLKMTPSTCSSNPYELYVYANRVRSLPKCVYHYASATHDLACVRTGSIDISEMLGGQHWTANAQAVVFLVAHFARTAWQQHLAMAYRSVMQEAGFIGQNIALMATQLGLSAVPVSSLRHSLVDSCLGTPAVETS